MRPAFRIALYCTLICLTPGTEEAIGGLSIIKSDRWMTVAEVFDGDTFRATNGEIVRLLGIDCPELTKHNKPGEPLATQAKAALRGLIGGQVVRLKTDVEKRDRYDRLLAQVYLRDGTWINGELIAQGWAHVYTFPPNIRWAGDLLKLERSARRAKRGIWDKQRFQVLNAASVRTKHLGQFRLIQGVARDIRKDGFVFRLGKVKVSVPRKYRRYFNSPPRIRPGSHVVVHGALRMNKNQIWLALHNPTDLEILSP
ncbi:MAG: thermonuclease family protein [Mariprofundaceae bacterium]